MSSQIFKLLRAAKWMLVSTLLLSTPTLLQGQQSPQQTPQKPATGSEECGPLGCLGGAGGGSAQRREASPVVIRTDDTGTDTTAGAKSSAKPVAAPLAPTAFETFVAATLGHGLPTFGRDLFQNTPADFEPPTSVSPPEDYVIGPGDELRIRTYGKIDTNVQARVDRNGQIFIPQVGPLTVAGLRGDQATEAIRAAISKQFKGFELSVTFGQLRSIQIFVVGQARRPGVYTVSSLSTLVNALFLSGGPSSTGTLRDIQLKRDGAVVTHFDVYRFLLQGDKSADVHLLPGDIIYIPLIGPQVAVDGDVTTPGIFELKGPSTVGSTLEVAGGLTPLASLARVVLEHVVDHEKRTVQELALTLAGRNIPVQGGDILRVLPISPRIEDVVTLKGSVGSPGRYEWKPGMRVSDLIPNRQFLVTREYYNRLNAQSTPARETFGVSSGDDASKATGIDTHETEINWNYAVIERLGTTDLTTHLVPFALGEAVDTPSSTENKLLQPGDVVIVYARKDIQLPRELEAKFVTLDGQVNAPGLYRVEQNETLRDVVKRAGGLAPHAYLYAAQLTRESVRTEQEAKLKNILDQVSQRALSPANAPVARSGTDSGSGDLALRRAYIDELRKVKPTGRVVLQLKPDVHGVEDVPEFALEDGDHLFVPAVPNTVDVLGSVYNEGALRYVEGGRVGRYLDAAGGVTREGDSKRAFVLRADGTITSKARVYTFDRLTIHPGDTVVVPPRLKPGYSSVDLLNLTQVLSAFALSAVAIKALQ